ncbi:hypothetical protein C8J56DRAFT_802657, partial [Mycena floridula]
MSSPLPPSSPQSVHYSDEDEEDWIDESSDELETPRAIPLSSSLPRTTVLTPLPEAPKSDAAETSGPDFTSPIRGRGAERLRNARIKNGRKSAQKTKARREAKVELVQIPKATRITEAFTALHGFGISVMDVMSHVFDTSKGQGVLRWHGFFNTRGNVTKVLDFWMSSRNPVAARTEVSGWAQDHVQNLVRAEARAVTEGGLLQTGGKRLITVQNVFAFDLQDIFKRFKEGLANVTIAIFEAASKSPRREGKESDQRAQRTQIVATSNVLNSFGEYSHANNFHKRVMALYLYATGSQRQQISVLSHVGITESYTNLISKDTRSKKQREEDDAAIKAGQTPKPPIGGSLKQLSDSARQTARSVASTGLYGTVYDNININFRNAEQVIGRHGM